MTESLIVANEVIIIILLLVAIGASIILRHLKLPYTIGLVIIGYILSEYVVPHVAILKPLDHFFPAVDVILYIFLPPLIFESAVALNTRLLRRNIIPVLGLALFGVVISAVIIGYLISWFFAIPLLYALLFGALISSTDPVAVISIFKEIGVPKRLQILVEGESLLNDAASIIMFQLVLLLISHPLFKSNLTFLETSSLFASNLIVSLCGGIIIGIIGGVLLRRILWRIPLQVHIHQTATLVAAYLTYLISDEIGFSGVTAVVICGFFAARAASDWIGPDKREELSRFWEYIGFIANSLIFLLVGITIATLEDLSVLAKGGILGIICVIGAVLIARFVPVFGIFGIYNRFTTHRVPLTYQAVCFWGGLRGAVAIALFLSIPHSLPFRDLIVAFSVTIVIFTIFIQGLTIGPLIRLLNLGQTGLIRQFHELYADLVTARAAKTGLQSSVFSGIIAEEIIAHHMDESVRLSEEKEKKILEFWDRVHENPDKRSVLKLFRLEALRHEQKQYRHLYDNGYILPPTYADLEYDTTMREDLIQSGQYHPVSIHYSPRFRFRMRIRRIIDRLMPQSSLSEKTRVHTEISHIFTAIAISVAAEATISYLDELVKWVCLDKAEIRDVYEFYHQLESDALGYLRSEPVATSGSMTLALEYLAERCEEAAIMTMLQKHLEEGVGDEKIIAGRLDALCRQKNSARKKLILSSGDQILL